MQVITSKKYSTELAAQPWHEVLDDCQKYFKNTLRADITTESGFSSILSSESNRDRYIEKVASLVGNNPDMQDVVKDTIRHSCEDVRNPFAVPVNQYAVEATDGLANNANYNSLAKMNSWLIVGYAAKSKCLELYNTITSDDPTVSFKYNIDYVMKGNDTKKYVRPQADRDGDLGDMYDLPLLAPTVAASRPHIEEITGASTNGGEIWIKVNPGISGNLFTESGEYDMSKYTLEKNPKITGIYYTIPASLSPSTATASGALSVYIDRKTAMGESQKKHFQHDLEIPYEKEDGTAAVVSASIMGVIDLDSGDYSFSTVGCITHIQLDVRLTNVANELGTIRAGSFQIIEDFSVDNHPYGSIPIVPEMSDDFNAGGEGVSAVAYFTDKVTSAMANARDVTMERDLDLTYQKGPDNAKLGVKLGGFQGTLNFPLNARLAGGSDPFSWMKTGLKDSITFHLSQAEMSTFFEDNTPRQWYILGSEYDTQRIPDITYTNWDGDGGVGGTDSNYGFHMGGRVGFIDSMNRRVRVIGSHYKRHYKNASGARIPMRAVCKSLSIEQPTTVYLPYSFRVYSGIMTEYSKRTGLIVSARDVVKSLTCVQSRINLTGNGDGLYGSICSNNGSVVNNVTSAIEFPEGSSQITITAGNP